MHWRNIGNEANLLKLSTLWFLMMDVESPLWFRWRNTRTAHRLWLSPSNNQWWDIPVLYTTSQKSRHNLGLQPIFLTEKQQNVCWQRKNLRCIIVDYHIFIWAKIGCCRAFMKLQPSMAPAWFPPFHFDAKESKVLISLNRCGMAWSLHSWAQKVN